MIILGLTGSIGMGKSETARLFAKAGIPVFDSDAEVHKMQAPGGIALGDIEVIFPGVVKDDVLDRAALGARVFGDKAALKKLESIMFPLVAGARNNFVLGAEKSGAPMVLLDVPLLFENDLDKHCDYSVVVSAPADVQRARVLARPGMTEEKLDGILASQMPDADKRARADFIIETDKGIDDADQQVQDILKELSARG